MRIHVFLLCQGLSLLLLGLMAGFFFAFAVDVVPAMAQLDAAGYVTAQQWINRVVRNASFGLTYFGSAAFPFFTALAAAWAGKRRTAVGWLLVALVYFCAVFWVTRSVNVPINNELATWNASTPPGHWQQARDAWNESNLIRTWAAVACFASGLLLSVFSSRPRANA